MKTFEVELRGILWKVIEVEARDEDHAVSLAYEELTYDEVKSIGWETESVTQITKE